MNLCDIAEQAIHDARRELYEELFPSNNKAQSIIKLYYEPEIFPLLKIKNCGSRGHVEVRDHMDAPHHILPPLFKQDAMEYYKEELTRLYKRLAQPSPK